jgi:4-hydroxybenzoyl-CoA reductase subunit alpha
MEEFTLIGKPVSKVDAVSKVTGITHYADDLFFPHMLYSRLLGCRYPHARLKHVDRTRAQALPGVPAVITGADLPMKYGILPSSHDETDWPGIRAASAVDTN